MSKKILLISAVILVLTVMLTACKGKGDDTKPENTDEVVQTVTVTGQDGGVTKVEIFEDTSGDKYITNVDGEKVPLTTDDQGFSDDIGYLVTSKPAEDKNPTSPTNNSTKQTDKNDPAGSTQPSSSQPSSSENSTAPESSTGGGIVIDSTVKQDSISWDDIKNPKK